MSNTVIINGENVPVEVTAYTMLIYEDSFKGHSFLRDVDAILLSDPNKVKFGAAVKILWAAAKTANEKIPNIEKWSKSISLKDAVSSAETLVELVFESLKSDDPKMAATATETV